MPPLRDLIAAIARRPGVAGALVVSEEGLVVDAAVPSAADADTAAALAVATIRGADGLGTAMGQGATAELVLDYREGTIVCRRLPGGALLVVLASAGADLGALLYDLRRHGPALSELT